MLKKENSIKVNGKAQSINNLGLSRKIKEMEWAYCFGLMALNMKDNLKTTMLMEREGRFMLMENTTKVNSRMTSVKDMGFTKILMGESMRDNGQMTSSMEKEKKSGTMEQRPMKETL